MDFILDPATNRGGNFSKLSTSRVFKGNLKCFMSKNKSQYKFDGFVHMEQDFLFWLRMLTRGRVDS